MKRPPFGKLEDAAFPIDSHWGVFDFWSGVIARREWYDPEREALVVFSLDGDWQPVAWHLVAIGSGPADVESQEFFQPALRAGAAAVTLAHNHPNGGLRPSRADMELTRQAVEAGDTLGLPVVDHFIVGRGSISLRWFVQDNETAPFRVAGWKSLKRVWQSPRGCEVPENIIAFPAR